MALYTYESPEPGDLTFREGDVILVSRREGEWWSGSEGDRMGLFPGNYVKPKETDVRTVKTVSLTHPCFEFSVLLSKMSNAVIYIILDVKHIWEEETR